MLVIWAETQNEARDFAQAARVGSGGVIFAGNRMARSLDGLRPSAIIEVGGARHLPGGADMLAVLQRATYKASKPVPWLQLGELSVPAGR